jgi:hypothetical protein
MCETSRRRHPSVLPDARRSRPRTSTGISQPANGTRPRSRRDVPVLAAASGERVCMLAMLTRLELPAVGRQGRGGSPPAPPRPGRREAPAGGPGLPNRVFRLGSRIDLCDRPREGTLCLSAATGFQTDTLTSAPPGRIPSSAAVCSVDGGRSASGDAKSSTAVRPGRILVTDVSPDGSKQSRHQGSRTRPMRCRRGTARAWRHCPGLHAEG